MSSALQPNLFATTSLAQSVFQLCGVHGIKPANSIMHGDFLGVAQAEMPNPRDFIDPADFARAYQAYNLLRKYSAFPINIDRAAVALDGFYKSEVSCGRVNREVDSLPYVPGVPLGRQQQSRLEYAKRLIARKLGKFDLEEFQMACGMSTGASTRCPRKKGHTFFKLEGKPHVTINCRDLAVHYIWCNESWRKSCQDRFGRESDPYSWVQVTPGSRFDTVAKDSLKDRPICIEPELNMFFQKGIGKMIRRRLLKAGINLNDQTLNQWLALLGSIDGSLATIDLRNASDSVALRVCEMLLPESWYRYILMTRSPYVFIDGKWVRLEKVSSMGNGFTFELESLIFWALSVACTKLRGLSTNHLSVYGDDIIVPTEAATDVIELLGSLGFETNNNKTFIDGPFRESCGKHYFLGADVSPFKIEDPIETWADTYHFCNSLQEWGWADQSKVGAIVAEALKPIPPRLRCKVPRNMGSKTGLRVDTPPMKGRYDPELGCFVYKFHYMREVTNDHDLTGPIAYLAYQLNTEQQNPSKILDAYEIPEPVRYLEPEAEEVVDYLDMCQLSRVEKQNWIRVCGSTSAWTALAA